MSNNSSVQPEDYFNDVTLSDYPRDWQVVLTVNSILIAIASLTLNSLIIWAISRNKELRTPTNTFIVSLATGEVLFSLFCLPFTAASLLENSWPYSLPTCKGSAFLQTLGRTVSSYSLLLVCFDRYIAISRPLKYTHVITQNFSFISIAIIWSLALVLCILLLTVWDPYSYSEILYMCMAEIAIRHSKGALLKEILSSYVPVFLTLTYLLAVLKEVRSHNRIFALVPVPATSTNANHLAGRDSVFAGILSLPRAIGGFNRNTKRALRSFFIMALSYMVLCSPISVFGLVLQERVTLTSRKYSRAATLTLVPMWLSILHCIVNPVIIISFNRKFQSQIMSLMLSCSKTSRNPPEVFTVSTGLHSVLDTTFIKTLGHGGGGGATTSTALSFKRTRGISVAAQI